MRHSLFALLLILLAGGTASAQPAGLRISTDRDSRVVAADAEDGAFNIDVLGLLDATMERTGDGARVLLFGETLRFWTGSPFFLAGDRLQHLALPVAASDGDLLLPGQFLTEWLPLRFADRVAFHDSELVVGSTAVTAARDDGGALRASATAAGGQRGSGRVVVIDPGHGGVDAGRISTSGVREKDVTLGIAARLADVLRNEGYEVHLTRTTDVLVPLDERPRLANRWKDGRAGALFLSIHANAAESHQAAGFETFFLAEARTDDERRVAERENAAARFETEPARPVSEVDHILNGLRTDFYQRASNDLAHVIQDAFAAFHPGRNRGVKQAGFRVLIGAHMPAVLIEVGFLSNAGEARLLAGDAFQQRIADGIAGAVHRFFDGHTHLLVSSPQ